MMGKKQNLSHLTDEERDKIMDVLQKDFELRRAEKKLINEAHDELVKEKNRIALLKEKEKFNESSCIICLERFGVLFHRKRKCHKCELNVCSDCSQAREKKKKGFICKVCSKEKAYKMLSNEWFYHNDQANEKNSGSSSIARWLHKKPAPEPADTDVDSGYNHSSCSSAGPGKPRARLDNVFDIKIKERVDEELPLQSSEATSLSNSKPLEALSPDQVGDLQPVTRSETAFSIQPEERTSNENASPDETVVPKIVPKPRTSLQNDNKSQSTSAAAPNPLNRNIQVHVQDTEEVDRTKKTEESNFRAEFDKFLRDLYETLDQDDLDGTNSESPSYEDTMQTFRDNITNLLRGFTHRLQVAHEKCEPGDVQYNHREKVQRDVCRFIGGFIGENVNVTSDAAMTDLFSAVKDASQDDSSFEDLLAQAVVSKLFDNHYDEVREALWSSSRHSILDSNTEYTTNEQELTLSSASDDDDANNRSNFDDKDGISEGYDTNTELQEMKEFVKSTPKRPRIEVSVVDVSSPCEVNEDAIVRTEVERDQDREEFCARFSILDRIHNPTATLPDISYLESGDSVTDETDPDLLSLNLAIIPEETEEEVELDRDRRTNWFFKGKGSSTDESPLKTNEQLSPRCSFRMRVPVPDNVHVPKIGHRNIDQLSDFSDLDGSDDEENTFYANTSTELARIAKQRVKLNSSYQLSDYHSEDSDRSGRLKQQQTSQKLKPDKNISQDRNPEVVVESIRSEINLLENLIPAENDDPTFLVAPEGAVIQEGEPVKFSCRVGGTGHIDVFWYREGTEVEELEDSSDVDISCDADRHSIVLYNVSKALAGQYMCIAVNEKGKTVQYFVLTVKDNKLGFKKPEFLKGLKDVEVTEGQSVKFRVKVKGYPQPRVNWYKDEKLLKNSRQCRIEKFGNRDYVLAIDRTSMEDDAEYTVVARNVAGEYRMSAQVIVEPLSDLPMKKQNISTTTSGVSDSDSDRPLSYHNLNMNRNSRNITSLPCTGIPTQIFTSTSAVTLAGRHNQGRLQVNLEDDRRSSAQKQSQTAGQRRLLTDDVLDDLKIAADIIQQEHNSSYPTRNQRLFTEAFDSTDNTDSGCPSINSSSTQKNSEDPHLKDFYLPDSLDDCHLSESPTPDQYQRDGDSPDVQNLDHGSSHVFSLPQSTDSEMSESSAHDRTLSTSNVSILSEFEASEQQPENSHDKSVVLPSVDKLKGVFSTVQDRDDTEAGTLKRVHSITGRNVPMEQLESLRATQQSQTSSSSSGNFLDVPHSSPTASFQMEPESQRTHNKSSPSPSDLRPPSSATKAPSPKPRHSFKIPTTDTYTTIDGQREPVLIYQKTNHEDAHKHREPQTEHMLSALNQQKQANQRPSTATNNQTLNHSQNSETKRQTKGQQQGSETVPLSGPRIKGGCISARTAFWERKIAQGETESQEEFPDMVEGDT